MNIPLPAFFPDGTRGVVRCVDSTDLENAKVPGIVMNTYHLLTKPGTATIKALGGLHKFCNWQRPIITDSGGFQVFSLLRENASLGEIRKDNIIFRRDGKKTILSPEKCIQAQLAYGSDVLMALDYCTHPSDNYETQAKSVETTIRWARLSMEAFRGNKGKTPPNGKGKRPAPQIFGIIQGGNEKPLRKECADALIQMGFGGFGFGGWPLDDKNNLTEDILAYTAELMPDDKIKYAMGIGRPENIVTCVRLGYTLFDCVIPTREARHHRLYVFNEEFEKRDHIDLSRPFYKYHYILDDIHRRDTRPVSTLCDCLACTNYSRAYLRHLVSIGDGLGSRLATIHNLRFYTMLMELLRK
jgi:queuine tRNA-ribosyltransferase